jgi:hypothetical protein
VAPGERRQRDSGCRFHPRKTRRLEIAREEPTQGEAFNWKRCGQMANPAANCTFMLEGEYAKATTVDVANNAQPGHIQKPKL